jgi:hypothetical protein
LVKIPLVGRISLLAGPPPVDEAAEQTNVVKQIGRYVWNPMGFAMLVLLPAVLFFGSLIGDVMIIFSPDRHRKQLRKKRLERLKKRWPKARLT